MNHLSGRSDPPLAALGSFQTDGRPVSCEPYGCGHINDTYRVKTDTGTVYILQKINRFVFHDPKAVMENVAAITSYLRARVAEPREVLHFIPAERGEIYHVDDAGDYWRCYEFADGICLEEPRSERDFYESAIAFGRFQELLHDFPVHTLHVTIPRFHDTVDRYRLFDEALRRNAAGRAAQIAPELAFILARREEAGTICTLLERGELPVRVTHNDTKLNNVLLDKTTNKALCVLDLDTVMPGSSLYDFGDSIRFGAATAPEDEPELSKMRIDLNRFRVYTEGYLSVCRSLTKKEIDLLPLGAKIITLELGVRFLTDYLDGDCYFKTAYPEHNLVRARAQLKLVADMEEHWAELQEIVASARSDA